MVTKAQRRDLRAVRGINATFRRVRADLETLVKTSEQDERAMVERALGYANGEDELAPMNEGDRRAFTKLLRAHALPHLPSEEFGKLLETMMGDMRQELRKFLGDVIANRPAALRKVLAEARDSLEGLWLLPVIKTTETGIQLGQRVVFRDDESRKLFVSILLLDEGRPFAGDLCQCKLAGCDKFFLAQYPETGRPQRKYCTRDHMLEAHARQSTKRAQKSRTGKQVRKPK